MKDTTTFDQYAIAAMQGLLMAGHHLYDWDRLAKDSYKIANKMWSVRNGMPVTSLDQLSAKSEPRERCTCRMDGNHGVDSTGCPSHSLAAMLNAAARKGEREMREMQAEAVVNDDVS